MKKCFVTTLWKIGRPTPIEKTLELMNKVSHRNPQFNNRIRLPTEHHF